MIEWLIFNGETVHTASFHLPSSNRAFRFGDGVFETIRFNGTKALWWEDHYFRLMATMRIWRMNIPMTFTPEYFEGLFSEILSANNLEGNPARLRLSVFRKPGGYYTPEENEVDFLLEMERIPESEYPENKGMIIDLFKDHYKPEGLLSNAKSLQCMPSILGSIYAKENGLDDVLLLNPAKMLAESTRGNVFVVLGNELVTPPLEAGCVRGIVRKQVLKFAKQLELQVSERNLTPFELLKAREVWITNAIRGVVPVKTYRTQTYDDALAQRMQEILNREAVS